MGEVSPWAVIGTFVAALAATVIYGLRLMLVGKLVPGRIHDEVRVDRDAYRNAAETVLKASGEMSSNVERLTTAVGQLSAAVEQQAAMLRETLSLVRQLRERESA